MNKIVVQVLDIIQLLYRYVMKIVLVKQTYTNLILYSRKRELIKYESKLVYRYAFLNITRRQ